MSTLVAACAWGRIIVSTGRITPFTNTIRLLFVSKYFIQHIALSATYWVLSKGSALPSAHAIFCFYSFTFPLQCSRRSMSLLWWYLSCGYGVSRTAGKIARTPHTQLELNSFHEIDNICWCVHCAVQPLSPSLTLVDIHLRSGTAFLSMCLKRFHFVFVYCMLHTCMHTSPLELHCNYTTIIDASSIYRDYFIVSLCRCTKMDIVHCFSALSLTFS